MIFDASPWVPDHGVIAGDEPSADGSAVMTEREWSEGLSSHEAVILRYSMRTAADVAEERQRSQRLAALRQKAEDEAGLVQLGLGPARRSHADVLRDYAAEAERLDKLEDRERAMRAEERAERAAQRIAELESQRPGVSAHVAGFARGERCPRGAARGGRRLPAAGVPRRRTGSFTSRAPTATAATIGSSGGPAAFGDAVASRI